MVSAPGRGSAPRGSAPEGSALAGGEGWYPSMQLRQTPSPCGQTDKCKNITFTTSLRTVIMHTKFEKFKTNLRLSTTDLQAFRVKKIRG